MKSKLFKVTCFTLCLLILAIWCKHADAQNLKWANQYNGAGDAFHYWANKIYPKTKCDSAGNVFTAGLFNGTTYFGGDSIHGTLFASVPSYYIMKCDTMGKMLWVKKIKG